MLCNEVLNGLTGSLKGIGLNAGKDFDVIAVSFDARENEKPELAKNKKASYMERYGRPGTENGWHFLTATQDSIDKMTAAAGFKYEWDEKSQQFAHVGGIMITTPDGRLSRYFYGIDYAPNDIKFGLMDSAAEKIGNPAERLLLYCYHYDPASGKYGLAVLRVMRIASVATIAGIGLMLFVFWRRNKSRQEKVV
jgi:protein SCO1/2